MLIKSPQQHYGVDYAYSHSDWTNKAFEAKSGLMIATQLQALC
jgi:hypothetical protein